MIIDFIFCNHVGYFFASVWQLFCHVLPGTGLIGGISYRVASIHTRRGVIAIYDGYGF
ncbi:hypothetical protein ES703_85235 [subsurface metagenome]